MDKNLAAVVSAIINAAGAQRETEHRPEILEAIAAAKARLGESPTPEAVEAEANALADLSIKLGKQNLPPMPQLTEEQATLIRESGVWRDMQVGQTLYLQLAQDQFFMDSREFVGSVGDAFGVYGLRAISERRGDLCQKIAAMGPKFVGTFQQLLDLLPKAEEAKRVKAAVLQADAIVGQPAAVQ